MGLEQQSDQELPLLFVCFFVYNATPLWLLPGLLSPLHFSSRKEENT